MRAKGLVVAALLVLAACSVRMAGPPSPVAPAPAPAPAPVPAPAPAPAQPAAKPPAPEPPVTGAANVGVAGSAGGTTAAGAPQTAAGTATAAAAAPAAAAKAEVAPPATASAYVFSAQQAVSAPKPSTAAAPAPTPANSAPVDEASPAKTPDSAASPSPTPAPTPSPSPSPTVTPGELQLVVVASSGEITAGGIVTVDVMASSSTAVVDAPLHLSFDPQVMEFVDGAPGDFLTQGGSSVVFLADGLSRPGDVAVAAGRVERVQGASGAGLLCRVHLRGVAAGTTPVVVGRAKAWGAQGEELTVLSSGTAVVVH